MNQQYKAIIIDDEPAARRLLKSLLQEYADIIEVIGEAGNGKDAIARIEEMKPDVIFLDIQMPNASGFDLLNQISLPRTSPPWYFLIFKCLI